MDKKKDLVLVWIKRKKRKELKIRAAKENKSLIEYIDGL